MMAPRACAKRQAPHRGRSRARKSSRRLAALVWTLLPHAPVRAAAAEDRPEAAPTIWAVGRPQGHIAISDEVPPPKIFYEEYLVPQKPVLFRGAARRMPAYSLWTDEYLRDRYGKVKMDQVETEKKETRQQYPIDDWTLSEFLDKYNKSNIYSTATTPQGLSNEVYLLPAMNCGGFHSRMSSSVLWFSSGSTKSVIHADAQENIHCMFAGRKDWILWPRDSRISSKKFGWVNAEEEKEKDPNFKDAYGAYVGKIDVDAVDLQRYPSWDKLRWWNMTLSAGDCAYIPKSWFHYVEAPPQRSISVHVWFHAGKSFNDKTCKAIEGRGYDLSTFLVRLSDCTWGFGEDGNEKPTRCKLHKSLPSGKPAQASVAAPRQEEL